MLPHIPQAKPAARGSNPRLKSSQARLIDEQRRSIAGAKADPDKGFFVNYQRIWDSESRRSLVGSQRVFVQKPLPAQQQDVVSVGTPSPATTPNANKTREQLLIIDQALSTLKSMHREGDLNALVADAGIQCKLNEGKTQVNHHSDSFRSEGSFVVEEGSLKPGKSARMKRLNSKMLERRDVETLLDRSIRPKEPSAAEDARRAQGAVEHGTDMTISQPLFDALFELTEFQYDVTGLAEKVVEIAGSRIVKKSETHLFLCLHNEIQRMDSSHTLYSIDTGLIGFVAQNKRAIALESPESHPMYDAHMDAVPKDRWLTLIPFVWNAGVVAVLRLVTERRLTQEEVMSVTCLALQAAPLIGTCDSPVISRDRIHTGILRAIGELGSNVFESDHLVQQIVESSKMLLSAERCALFRVDDEAQQLVSKIEDRELRVSINAGIAGFVAVSGRGQNISNAYKDPRFNRAVDQMTGYHTKQILCMPLKCDGKTIAVAQLVNKVDAPRFTPFDESVFETYSTFAATALRNNKIFRTAHTASEVNEELLLISRELSVVTLDDSALRYKIIESAKKLVNADRGTLFVADWETSELVGEVDGNTITMPINAGIAGSVLLSGQSLNITDAYADPRFNKAVDQHTGYTTETVLATPIKYMDKVIAVAQLINKKTEYRGGQTGVFTKADEVILNSFGSLAGIAIKTAQQFERGLQEKERFRGMLAAAASLIEYDIRDNMEKLCERLIADVRSLIGCYAANIHIVTNDGGNELKALSSSTGPPLHFNTNIAQHVIRTGKVFRTADAHTEVVFDETQDRLSGFVTKTVLAMPVGCLMASEKRHVFAVIELINKDNDRSFTEEDETTLLFFCTLAAFTIKNAKLLEFESQNRASAMSLMSQASFSPRVRNQRTSGSEAVLTAPFRERVFALSRNIDKDHVSSFEFNIHEVENSEVAQLATVHAIMEAYHLLSRLQVNANHFLNFAAAIRRRYRKVPYHNFLHALDVMQTLLGLIRLIEGGGSLPQDANDEPPRDEDAGFRFSDYEKFLLLICGLCHDVDHMGLNSSFHYGTQTPMGILSNITGSSSPLEVHHCNVMFTVMQSQECSVLSALSKTDQVDAATQLIELVLATDMVKHQEFCNDLRSLPRVNPSDCNHRRMTLIMLIKLADISNTFKPFAISRLWALKVMEEFHDQGDKEKYTIGKVTSPINEREGAETSDVQCQFIEHVSLPFTRLLADKFPQLSILVDRSTANLQEWKQIAAARKEEMSRPSPTEAGSPPSS